MFNLYDLNDRLEHLEIALGEKGVKSPEVTAKINWCGRPFTLKVEYVDDGRWEDTSFRVYDLSENADYSVEDALVDAETWIAQVPDAETRAHERFVKSVARVIDEGRELGIDVDFLNPLSEMMKKLSENVLTHRK